MKLKTLAGFISTAPGHLLVVGSSGEREGFRIMTLRDPPQRFYNPEQS
jgi:hypothetical protein